MDISLTLGVLLQYSKACIFDINIHTREFSMHVNDFLLFAPVSQSEDWLLCVISWFLVFEELNW